MPTMLVDVPDDALIMREETFAPIAAVTPFDSEPEVIARAAPALDRPQGVREHVADDVVGICMIAT